MINENKVSKYMLYAIGEIVLVVIGILIALQINNWNEQRKDNKQEFYILKQLQKEFKADSSQISNYIRLTKIKTKEGKKLRKAVKNKRYSISKDSLAKYAFFNGRLVLFDGYTPTFDEIVSSGNLNIIKSEKLKSMIKNYKNSNMGSQSFMYNESQKLKEAYNKHLYNYFEPEIMTYLWENGSKGIIDIDSLNNYKMDVKGFFDDTKTLYHINTTIGVDRELSWRYSQRDMQRIQKILQELQLEIDKISD